MRLPTLLLTLSIMTGFWANTHAQTGRPSSEKIWKDLSRLPQTLREDLKKSSWWKSVPTGKAAAARLDSTITSSHFSNEKFYPLNKSTFEYNGQTCIQSDFVNYGEWILQKRTTVTRDDQNRITEVLEEEPDPGFGGLQPANKFNFYWRGSTSHCDSILSSQWDDNGLQWLPVLRLRSTFDEQDREMASETYRYDEGLQTVGIREEYQFDAAGDVTATRQLLLKEGKWNLLGKVDSKFDKMHHEISRQEEIAQDADHYTPVRKLSRTYDVKGNLTREERYKWNEGSKQWSPLKTLSKGLEIRTRSEWTVTESYKPNAFFKSRSETFKRKTDDNPDREVQAAFKTDTKKWQIQTETKYYYAK